MSLPWPSNWEIITISMINAAPKTSPLTFQGVVPHLLEESACITGSGTPGDSSALIAKQTTDNWNRGSRTQGKKSKPADNKRRPTCNYCLKPGHAVNECHLQCQAQEATTAQDEAVKRIGKESTTAQAAKATTSKTCTSSPSTIFDSESNDTATANLIHLPNMDPPRNQWKIPESDSEEVYIHHTCKDSHASQPQHTN
ncbi:hypothetical protein BS47DRAFT_1395208 [Hydnum rufescens UP504]|uniref:Uncharacterized protein n=1 Tax=Hydnum rufescens UP504 TaxID=1448309 RepID=A0A9P6DU58_9AGAM|nr:hypothetical protein BS47DRAFT_1395208 [Hydnum rufescens UP504]